MRADAEVNVVSEGESFERPCNDELEAEEKNEVNVSERREGMW